ncbi:MAG: GxxExxY protein [Sulfuricaulis sp.]|nr:GxxExxY protein [Sulfuricaulis sp.]
MKPQINADERGLEEITGKIIGCAYTVSNTLGCGFLEKVYENALVHELRKAGFEVEPQKNMKVMYDGVLVGEYIADILVQGIIILEIKAVKILDEIHVAQCLNYLKATGLKLCLLVNFGVPKVAVKRVVNNL